ncbi:hypothetical protein MPER_13884, partial [Moniliophthora perniciosa FA553]
CREGKVVNIEPAGPISQPPSNVTAGQSGYEVDAHGSIVLPSLCHSHIHLDKCFILGRGGDLITGDFTEAMNVTGKAKAGFSLYKNDL